MKISATFACLLLTGAQVTASAQTTSGTSGSLTVNGKVTQLRNAQAMKAQHYGFGANGTPVLDSVTVVFLSDASADDLDDNFELVVKAKQGKLHALLLTITSAGKLSDGTLYHDALKDGAESIFTSHANLKLTKSNAAAVAGSVKTTERLDLVDAKEKVDGMGGKLDFSVSFTAPIQHDPKPTVEGPAAAQSAPAKVVEEFIQAAEAKDVTAMKRVVRSEVVAMLDDPQGQQMLVGLLGESYPPGKKITIVRVFDFGERAWVEGDSQRTEESGKLTNETYKIRAIKENGAWKVSPL